MKPVEITIAVVLLATLVFLIPAPAAGTTTVAPSNTLFWTTATTTTSGQATFWQNVSETTYGASTPVTFPGGLPGATPVSSVLSSILALSVQVQGGYTPRLTATQGATVLLNQTVPYSQTLTPGYSTTGVAVKAVSLYNPLGQNPNMGTFQVYYNGTSTIQFETNTTATWGGGGLNWKLTYQETAPPKWAYSQSSLFVPFPSTAVNYTSVRMTLGKVTTNTYIVESRGVFATLPNLAAGNSQWINVTFGSAASTSGPGPVVTAAHFTSFGVNTNLWQFNVTWTNPYTVPYAGPLTMTAQGLPGAIAPTSVTVTVNNSSALTPTAYSVSGSYLTILPGVLTVGPGSTTHVTAVFGFAAQPPSGTLTGTMVVWSNGIATVTVNTVMFSLLGAVTAVAGVGWVGSERFRQNTTLNLLLLTLYGILFTMTTLFNIGNFQ